MAYNVEQIKFNLITCDCRIIRIFQKKGDETVLVYSIGAREDKENLLTPQVAAQKFEEFVKNHPNMSFLVKGKQKTNDPVDYEWILSTKEQLALNGSKSEPVDISSIRENIKNEIFQEIKQQEEKKAFETQKEELAKQLKELESYGERLSMIAEYALQKLIGKFDLSKIAPALNGIIETETVEPMAETKQGTQDEYQEIFKVLIENVSIDDLKVLAKAIKEKPSIVKKAIAFL